MRTAARRTRHDVARRIKTWNDRSANGWAFVGFRGTLAVWALFWGRRPAFGSPAIPIRFVPLTWRSFATKRIGGGLPDGFFPGAPDLAVEVLSPSDRAGDVLAKVQDWLNAGTAAVWVVDPKTQTVTIYGADRKAAILTSTDTLSGGDLLPGFSVPVAELFARL